MKWRAFLHKKRANRTKQHLHNRTNKHKDTSRTNRAKQHLHTNTNDFLLAHLHKLLARALANHLPVASALYALARQLGVVSCVSLTAGAFKMLRRFPFCLVLLFGSCLLFPFASFCLSGNVPVVLLLTGALFVLFLAIAVVFFLWKQFLLSFRSLSKGFPVLGNCLLCFCRERLPLFSVLSCFARKSSCVAVCVSVRGFVVVCV